jgi:hypothetical protein
VACQSTPTDQTRQFLQQLRGGGGKIKICQFRFVHPFERRATQRLRCARKKLADEKFQVDGFLRVGVRDFVKQFADGNFHAEFLTDFTDETLLKSFAGFALAAGKFPKSPKMRVRMTLGDEQFAVVENERSGNGRIRRPRDDGE